MSSEKKVTLKSSDDETFEVEETVAFESQTIKHMVEDDCADTVIPLRNVTSTILSKVIEYCKKHVEARSRDKEDDMSTEDDLKSWDADFVKANQHTLFDLIMAANNLNIRSLVDLTCQAAADMVKGKTPDVICKIWNIKNEITLQQRAENSWLFE